MRTRDPRDVLLCPGAITDAAAGANCAGEHEHQRPRFRAPSLPPSAGGLITACHARARLIEDGPHATTTDLRLPPSLPGPRPLPPGRSPSRRSGRGNRVEEE